LSPFFKSPFPADVKKFVCGTVRPAQRYAGRRRGNIFARRFSVKVIAGNLWAGQGTSYPIGKEKVYGR
jgi:hypothetical protein